jgi:NADPH-dependent glutamate synthase beta subunit-like oxidoreductase
MNGEPVAIREVERFLSDLAWEKGWVVPRPPKERVEKSVAVIGSGPAGLTAAHILNQSGINVTVYEKSEEPGGLLMFGIPNMKLPKERVRQRVEILKQEGITFVCNTD